MSELVGKDKRAQLEWEATLKRIYSSTEVTERIKQETPKQKEKRIKNLLKPENFYSFIHYYFGEQNPDFAPLAWFHKQAIDNVLVKKHRKNIWEWHRESAKSVFANILIPMHKIATGDLKGMLLAGSTADKAKVQIKDIEAQLRKNQKFINDFGDFGIVGSWSAGFFTTKQGIGFWSFGIGQDPAGSREGWQRPNYGVVDDCDSFAKAQNQENITKMVSWVNGEFMGCLAKNDRCFVYVNNRVHKMGLTAHLVGDHKDPNKKDKSYAHIKASLTEDPITHEGIFPEGLTSEEMMEDLIAKGAVPAWKEYYSLQECVDKIIDYTITEAKRQLYHHHVTPGNIFNDENMPWVNTIPLHEYDGLVTYCDPAFGESGKGSFKAIVLMGKKGHNYDILWVWLRQRGNWIAAHRNIAENFHTMPGLKSNPGYVRKVSEMMKHWVEGNDLQKTELDKSYFIENLEKDVAWKPKYDAEKKAEKNGRVESMETTFNSKHMRFNEALKHDSDMAKLRDQFKEFPSKHIDGPDCVQGAQTKVIIAARGVFKGRQGKFIKSKKRAWQ